MSSGAQVLRPYVLRQWRALAGAAAGTAVLALAELAKPWPIALIVDHVIADHEAPFAPDMGVLLAIGGLILAIAIAETTSTYFVGLWLQSAGERIAHQLRVAIYDHLQRLSLAYHQRTPKGDLLTRVTEDVNDMGELFSDTLGEMLQAALLAFGMTVVLLIIDPVLALLSLVTAPLLVVISFVFRRKVRERARRQRHHEGDLASIANEALSAMTVVKAFGAGEQESERVRSRSEQRMGVGVEVARLQAGFDGTVGVLRACATAVVTVFGVIRVSKGDLSVGELVVFVSYTRKASSPMRSFAREAAKLTAALARADRIAEVLTEDDLIEDRPHAYRGGRARGELELEHVSFQYASERAALQDVSIKIAAGQRLALTGPSGAGKSTLAALVARFYDPTHGRVLIDGEMPATAPSSGCASRSPSSCRTPCCSREPCGRTSATGARRATRRSSTPPRPPPRTTSSSACPTATTQSSAPRAPGSPAASASASASPARCCAIHRSSSSTSPPRRSTPTVKPRSWTGSIA